MLILEFDYQKHSSNTNTPETYGGPFTPFKPPANFIQFSFSEKVIIFIISKNPIASCNAQNLA